MSDRRVPMAELWEWQYEGLCRTTNPDTFFHPEGERGPSRRLILGEDVCTELVLR